MTDKFDVKITYEHGIHYLTTTRNGCQWSSAPVDTPKQMCKIAKALIDQAHKLTPEHCPDCGIELDIDYEAMEGYESVIDALTPDYLALWCENCEKAFNGLGDRE